MVEAAIAEEVLVLHSDGWTIRAIAKQLGLSRMAAHRIVAARPAELAEPGEISAMVTRLRRLCDRLERANGGVRLSASEVAQVTEALKQQITGLVGS
jgi:hypothetical protein